MVLAVTVRQTMTVILTALKVMVSEIPPAMNPVKTQKMEKAKVPTTTVKALMTGQKRLSRTTTVRRSPGLVKTRTSRILNSQKTSRIRFSRSSAILKRKSDRPKKN